MKEFHVGSLASRRESGQLRKSEQVQPLLGLAGKIQEQHRNGVTGVTIAVAGHHNARASDFPGFSGRLQGNRHLGPDGNGRWRAKFNPVFPESDGVGRQTELSPVALKSHGMENSGRV
jgi:hypothetical protein